jgi:hypothetical protein
MIGSQTKFLQINILLRRAWAGGAFEKQSRTETLDTLILGVAKQGRLSL